MRRYQCGDLFDVETCDFDEDSFPVCPQHGARLVGWRSTSRSEPPVETLIAQERRESVRAKVEAARRKA